MSRTVLRPIREQIGVKVRVNETGFQPAIMSDECHDACGIYKVVDPPPKPTSDGYHNVSLLLFNPYEMDIVFLDIRVIDDGGDAKAAADWLTRMKLGYGFSGRRWTSSPLWTWQSRWIEMFTRASSSNHVKCYMDLAKQHPGITEKIEKLIEDHLEQCRLMQESLIEGVRKDPTNAFSIEARSHYFTNMTDHRRYARHWPSNEEMNLYMMADAHRANTALFPKKEIELGIFLTGIVYHHVEKTV